jgi:hypothetical protein
MLLPDRRADRTDLMGLKTQLPRVTRMVTVAKHPLFEAALHWSPRDSRIPYCYPELSRNEPRKSGHATNATNAGWILFHGFWVAREFGLPRFLIRHSTSDWQLAAVSRLEEETGIRNF